MPVKSSKNESGFTLLEVVAVLALTGVVSAVIVNSFLQSTFTQQQLAGRYTVTVLGEGKLSELLNDAELNTSGTFPKPYDQFNWSSESDTLENGMTAVALTVKWSGRDGKHRQKVFKGTSFAK
ncbi:MAG TPA: type II secretion system protein [Bacillota bacterium]|nr:type II secretion system protein [Bacillota bacterium]